MISRHKLAIGCAALACVISFGSFAQITTAAPTAPTATPPPNAIQVENQKTGTSAWQIGLPPYVNSNDTDQWIRGYASAVSINKGEKITFNITVNPYHFQDTHHPTPVPYTIDVYRVGWYGGLGGRLMKHLGPFPGRQQPGGTSNDQGATIPGCPYDSATGMIACNWSGDGLGDGSYTLDTSVPPDNSTSADWTSGIYLALLTTNQVFYTTGCGPAGTLPCDPDHQSYIIFTIREDARASQVLFQQALATYQAYNNYPDDGLTGKSLYDSGSYGPLTDLGTERAVKVSFDRPYTYADHTGAGDFLHWELYFVRWLERTGYDVTYTTDIDTHVAGANLTQHKAVLSVGHDEYWTHEMRQAFEAARDSGTSLAFFGANAVYSQIRLEPSTVTGVPNRVVVAYKDANLDPVNNTLSGPAYNPSLTTVPFRSLPVSAPEQSLTGVMYVDFFSAENPALAYVVQNSANWVYAGTGLLNGSQIPGVLGYEMDQYFSGFPGPVADPTSYVLVSDSSFTNANGLNHANSAIYEAPSGAWVFAAGTIDWSWGLDSYAPPAGINTRGVAAPSTALQQTTANILNRFLIVRPFGPTSLSATGSGLASKYKIALAWTNNATNGSGFHVERSQDNVTFSILATTSAKATTYSDSTAVAGAGYYYRVAAFNSGGNSPYSNVVLAGGVPTAPSELVAKAVSGNEIDLNWTDTSSNETGFTVERSTDNSIFTQIASLPSGSIAYSDVAAAGGTTYYYRVKAVNSFGSSLPSNVASDTTLSVPAAPTQLVATATSATQVTLAWIDNSTNESGFVIQRSTTGTTYGSPITVGANVTSYSDTTVLPRTKYFYRVQSFNANGGSAFIVTTVTTPRK